MSDAKPIKFSRLGENRSELEARLRRSRVVVILCAVCVGGLGVFAAGLLPRSVLIIIAIVVCVLFFGRLSWMSYTRHRANVVGEAYLAGLACPRCSKIFGAEVAHLARIGEFCSPKEEKNAGATVMDDMWGDWAIHCAHCSSRFVYDPDSHEFITLKTG